jgi:DNA-binding CsgD family transcriptional regulator
MKPAVTGSPSARDTRMASQLSPRQREILNLVAEGRTSKEIAVALGISESTVNWHLANAFERLGASSRAEAVALAIRSNGADRLAEPVPRVRATSGATRVAWPRLAAIAVAIAIAGALLGAATVATLRLGPAGPSQVPTAPPANGSQGAPVSSPPTGYHEDLVGGEIGGGLLPDTPATLVSGGQRAVAPDAAGFSSLIATARR